ncbi:MAG: sulfotransferase domain-containing protein [Phycisphaera sp.]|nr:MAG: sulfotransferase domain-containing protein [Phycisphaera sp.]
MASQPGHIADAGANLIPSGVKPVVVASHRRSGTHLMLDLLRRHFAACRPPFRFGVNPHRYLYFVLDRLRPSHPHHADVEACLRVMRTMEMPTLKTHNTPDFPDIPAENAKLCHEALSDGVVLYCVRDVRAVLASLQAFDASNNPKARVSLSNYIRQEVDGKSRPQIWAEHVLSWLDHDPAPNMIRFEDVMAEPKAMVEKLAGLLGKEPLLVDPVLPPKMRHRRQRWLAMVTGVPASTNIIGRKRAAELLDWRTGYTADDIEFLEEHTGDLMRRLGYLQGEDWSLSAQRHPSGG